MWPVCLFFPKDIYIYIYMGGYEREKERESVCDVYNYVEINDYY